MKIWHISDAHTLEQSINIPNGIDTMIFSGDAANSRNIVATENMIRNFIFWMKHIPIKNKIFVSGNHDLAIEAGLITRQDIEKEGIYYLENEEVIIDGIKFWGSPITKRFGRGWAYNYDEDKVIKYWKEIPLDVNVLITHGPAKGILDASFDKQGVLEHCGDIHLLSIVNALPKLKAFCFGHIHNSEYINNSGMYINPRGVIFSNGSIVRDNCFDYVISNGNIFNV